MSKSIKVFIKPKNLEVIEELEKSTKKQNVQANHTKKLKNKSKERKLKTSSSLNGAVQQTTKSKPKLAVLAGNIKSKQQQKQQQQQLKPKISEVSAPPPKVEVTTNASIGGSSAKKLPQTQILNRAPPFDQDKTLFKLHSKPEVKYNFGIAERLPLAPEEAKWAHKIRLAIDEGGSSKPQENKHLKSLILNSINNNFPWKTLERILENSGVPANISRDCFLIQMKFYGLLNVICCVKTKNIVALKKSLLPILRNYQTSYDSVINNFRHNCYIEALASYRTPVNFSNFEKQLAKDAMDCHAKAVEIIDYESGAIHFKCHPLQLADVVSELETKNYKVLFADYGLSPIDKIHLTEDERKNYEQFKDHLQRTADVKYILDNLAAPLYVHHN